MIIYVVSVSVVAGIGFIGFLAHRRRRKENSLSIK